MKRISRVDAAFDLAAAATGARNPGARVRVCATTVPAARRWTEEEDEFLRANLGRIPEAEIARRLKRSLPAVILHRKRELHLGGTTRHGDFFTANAIAFGLGIDAHSITKLIDRGIMPGHRAPTTDQRIRVVDRRALARWVLNPKNWAYIDPDRIGELRPQGKRPLPGDFDFTYWEDLRKLVARVRRRWRDQWLTPGQIMALLHLPQRSRYVNAAIRKGTLPAVRWGNWRIRKSSIPKGKTLNFRGDWVNRK